MTNNLTKSYTVMVVDDDRDLRNLLEAVIGREGWLTVIAANGSEALDWMQKSTCLPDLILTDWNMPGMGGVEFLSKLKQNDLTHSIPVVVVSGVDELESKTKSIGADGFLQKPYNLEVMTSLLKSYLH